MDEIIRKNVNILKIGIEKVEKTTIKNIGLDRTELMPVERETLHE